ncbi:MAG TPA: hypothetical protein PKY87_14640 [Terricaulis sp.]|nr:hypothetical protein [Terricaulis sp.]
MDPHVINQFDRERDRVIDLRANDYVTEAEMRDTLRSIDAAEDRAAERCKRPWKKG